MASIGPSCHRCASVDSRSSSDPSLRPQEWREESLLPAARHRQQQCSCSALRAAASVTENSSRVLVKSRDAKTGHTFGRMVKKLMEKRPSRNPGSAERTALAVPPDLIAEELKTGAKGSDSRLGPGNCTRRVEERKAEKVLTEVKANTWTIAMALHNERELLAQNKDYRGKDFGAAGEKLKDLCLKQREEIKAMKDAILFPDVMNSQLQVLLEKQGFGLKQLKQVITCLKKQVTSLTGQLQCLVKDLAEVLIFLDSR
ncbi:hypothetical protein GW17_00051541 [Ensete ventricosum]|nr:hypothetical protein GW17_00051541 [Ensete ventricosum]